MNSTTNPRAEYELPSVAEGDLVSLHLEVAQLEEAVGAVPGLKQRRRIEAQIESLKTNLLKRWEQINEANVALRAAWEKEQTRRQADTATKQSEERLNFALAAARMGTYDWLVETGELIWSEQTERLYGLEPGEFRRSFQHARELTHPDDHPRVMQLIEESMATGQDFQAEYRVVWPKDKSIHWHYVYGRVFLDAMRRPTRSIGAVFDITPRKHAEAQAQEAQDALRESRDQLDIVLNGVTDGITVLDRNEQFVYANEVAARMCGFSSAKELLEAPAASVMEKFEILDEDGGHFPINRLPGRLVLQGIKNPAEVVVQFRFRGSRETRWSLVTASPIYDERGQVQFAVNIFRDFTERKKNELEKERLLKEVASERTRLEAIINQLGAGVIIVDAPSGRAILRNKRVLEIWRYADLPIEAGARYRALKATRLDGKPLVAEDWPSYRSIHYGETVRNEELEIARGDGTRGYVTVSSDPIRDASGEIIVAVVTVQDVTELRRREQASRLLDEAMQLLSSSLDYKTTLEHVAKLAIQRLGGWVGVSFIGEDGKLNELIVAHADEKKIPIVREIRRLYPPDPTSGIEYAVIRTGKSVFIPEITEDMLVDGTKDKLYLQLVRKLGFKAVISTPLTSAQGTFGLINFASSDRPYDWKDLSIAEELAKRASLAIDNARLYQKAQEAIRVRDEFLSIASHELMTPLTSLKLQLQLTERRIKPEANQMPPTEKLLAMIDISSKQVERLTAIVGDLLDVSRIQAGKLSFNFEECKVEEILKEVVDRFLEQLLQARCSVEIYVRPGLTAVWDRFRIEQVMANLISNAIKYAPGSPISVNVEQDGERAIIRVQDAGPGIPRDRYAKIFERFERGPHVQGISGLGLGLSIVNEIVKGHQGIVHVESDEGQGAKFIVELPLRPRQ